MGRPHRMEMDMSTPEGSAPRDASTLRYKFVEVSPVTDESLEQTVNRWVAEGWHLEGIRFVTSEASRRPVMAFVSFIREDIREDAPAGVPEGDGSNGSGDETDGDPAAAASWE